MCACVCAFWWGGGVCACVRVAEEACTTDENAHPKNEINVNPRTRFAEQIIIAITAAFVDTQRAKSRLTLARANAVLHIRVVMTRDRTLCMHGGRSSIRSDGVRKHPDQEMKSWFATQMLRPMRDEVCPHLAEIGCRTDFRCLSSLQRADELPTKRSNEHRHAER